jgi:metal-dependent HD superfamily phosphatase/phosphodiesterase
MPKVESPHLRAILQFLKKSLQTYLIFDLPEVVERRQHDVMGAKLVPGIAKKILKKIHPMKTALCKNSRRRVD